MEFLSAEARYTLRFINQTNRSLFLTGKAGTGKTTLLREIIRTTHKNVVVVAPTGIAALNAGGVTIHSMFQLPFATFLPVEQGAAFSERGKFESRASLRRHFKMAGSKLAVMRNMELLVIDEVSMLRADLLDAIDFKMQHVRKDNRPFGGVQVLFIGDLLQLPPVVKPEEWQVLRQYYGGIFFFHAQVIRNHPPLYIELSKIFRQQDERFIDILNNLRHNRITQADTAVLNSFVQRDFDLRTHPGYVVLTTHNAKADAMNQRALQDLKADEFAYQPEIVGDFPDKIFPIDESLRLRVGAQIMFVKNDLSVEKQYYNGKMGVVKTLSEAEILVYFPQEDKTIEVDRYEWQNIKYSVNPATKEIEEEVVGTFTHFPIKLAWAITVHKSQGLTFDKAALDVSEVFAPGQAYVALSRLRSLDGLILLEPLRLNGIGSDQDVEAYAQHKSGEDALQQALSVETLYFLKSRLKNAFNWTALAQEWRSHRFSYREEAANSPKAKHASWAEKCWEKMDEILDPALRFGSQIDRIFASEQPDLNFARERVEAAFQYFYKPMDALNGELLWKLEEVKRIKKAKTFFEELLALEDLQTNAVLQLLKLRRLMDIVIQEQEISKDSLLDTEILQYRNRKIQGVQTAFKAANATLVDDDPAFDSEMPSRYEKKPKKEPKKNTVVQTFEMWEQKMSIKDIATARTLTVQTIGTHIAKLIQTKLVKIEEVLPEDKRSRLAEIFEGYTEETLTPLKEKYGDEFTWNDLKFYKASLETVVS